MRRLAAIVESSSDAIYTFQPDGAVLSWNKGAERTFGYEAAEIAGRSVVTLSHAGPESAQVQEFFAALERGETVEREAMARAQGRHAINLAYTAFPIRDDHGVIQAGGMIARDVTEQRRLEEQLRQAQKMEAVGQLAGGIAHDFNNLLTVITGYGQLARALVGEGSGASELEAIERAAVRATELTRQLLAFSRRQRLDPVVLDLSEVARGLAPMLRRLIGDDIEVEMALADALPEVLADAGQLEQVVINLALNARDAMPEGGSLVLAPRASRTTTSGSRSPTPGSGSRPRRSRTSSSPSTPPSRSAPGPGSGWPPCTARSRQSGGHIEVDSEPGRGTMFKFLLPATRRKRGAAVPERPAVETGSAATRRSSSARTRRACARWSSWCWRARATACSARGGRARRSSAPPGARPHPRARDRRDHARHAGPELARQPAARAPGCGRCSSRATPPTPCASAATSRRAARSSRSRSTARRCCARCASC